MEYKFTPKTKEELISTLKKEIDLQAPNADLNIVDASAITDTGNFVWSSVCFLLF